MSVIKCESADIGITNTSHLLLISITMSAALTASRLSRGNRLQGIISHVYTAAATAIGAVGTARVAYTRVRERNVVSSGISNNCGSSIDGVDAGANVTVVGIWVSVCAAVGVVSQGSCVYVGK